MQLTRSLFWFQSSLFSIGIRSPPGVQYIYGSRLYDITDLLARDADGEIGKTVAVEISASQRRAESIAGFFGVRHLEGDNPPAGRETSGPSNHSTTRERLCAMRRLQ